MEFSEMIRMELQRIDPTVIDAPADPSWAEPYYFIRSYAMERRLRDTAIALPLVQTLIFRIGGVAGSPFENSGDKYRHCMDIARIIIDLHIPLNPHDEDILLCATLCHILTLDCDFYRSEGIVDPEAFQIIRLIRQGDTISDEKRMFYIRCVLENRLALLLRLADRSNLAQQLHSFSDWHTRRYIYETRNIYLPMCMYAKDRYPDLAAPITILMEKMRSLIEVAEILLSRYERQETDLTMEILELQEENANLKNMIRAYGK